MARKRRIIRLLRRRIFRLLNSYSGRMVSGLLLLHLLLLPILLSKVLGLVEQSYTSQFVDNSRADAYLLSDLMASSDEQKVMYSYLEEAIFTGRVEYVNYQSLNSDYQIEIGKIPASFQEDFSFDSHGDDLYQIVMPVFNMEGNELATLQLAYDESSTKSEIEKAQKSVYGMMSLYLLVMLVSAILFSRALAKPIVQLRTLTRNIYSGDDSIDNGHTQGVKSRITEIQDLSRDMERTRQKLSEQTSRLEFQAYHDALTRLPNRILLEDRVDQLIRIAERHKTPFSLLLMDLDKFKEVNDTLGHHAGDQLLCMLTNRIKRSMRHMDTFARLSGDEFAIVLNENDEKQSLQVVEKIIDLLKRPFTVDENSLHIDTSIGIALYPDHAENYSDLLKCADIAMYDAKHQDKSYAVYDESMVRLDLVKIGMVSELRHAIENNELELYYQPKVDLKHNQISCVEALIRWNHPVRGILLPNEFIPIAEKSLLINELTSYVLDKAMHQCRKWQKQGIFLSVAVNLSARNLIDDTLPSRVQTLLRKYQLSSEYLELEVTESMVIHDPVNAHKVLSEFLDMGVRVVVDDFGSGYTSLTQLVTLPVSIIKIDKSFVLNMFKSTHHKAIVKSIIDLSRSLGKTVVSEGVENMKTLDEIRRLQSDQAQGFQICLPLPVADLDIWLRETQYEVSLNNGQNNKKTSNL